MRDRQPLRGVRPGHAAAGSTLPSRLQVWLAVAILLTVTGIAFGNSFAGRFVMDDISEIRLNESLGTLLPPWRAMFVGRVVPARPLPYLTFAIDRGFWGPDDPFGYHVTNLFIHSAAAVLLFGLARQTLLSPRLRDRFGPRATGLAAAIAAGWAVHPLQTQAVTYVYQRIESLCGLLMLAALFCFARAAAASWSRRWLAGSLAAAAAAMATKENAVVLPLLIAAWDWTYSADGPAGLRRRFPFHAAVFGTWLVLAAVVASQAGKYGEFQAAGPGPLAYALTQPRVILHYLRLAIVPAPLSFDYSWRTLTAPREFLPSLCYVGVVAAAAVVGLVRRRTWAWPVAAFLLALAPTSSVMPVAALVAEHRMYLPLAAVVALVVLGGERIVAAIAARSPRAGRVAGAAAAIAGCLWGAALVGMTRARNEVYAVPGGVWLDVIARQRENTRALWNLAAVALEQGQVEAALRFADETTALNPRLPVYRDLVEQARLCGDSGAADLVLRHGLERSTLLLDADDPIVKGLGALLPAPPDAAAAP